MTPLTVLIPVGLRRANIADKPHGAQPDLRTRRKTEILRTIRPEIRLANVAQDQPETPKHLVLGIRVLASAKVPNLCGTAAAFIAWGDISHFERTVAKWARCFLHGA
jgi:hypothetical protein